MKEVLRAHQSRARRLNSHAHGKVLPGRFRFRIYVSLLFTLAVLALLAGPGFYSSPAGAQSGKSRYQQDIEQVFAGHEDVTLDPQAAAERVRESGRLSIVTPTRDFEIQLSPNDLRASNYRAEEVSDGGVTRDVPMPAITTFKGSVEGVFGTDARFTLDGEHIEGMIITPQESYFVESARKYSFAAGANDYLVYKATDVRPDITRVCGTLDEEISRGARDIAPTIASGTVAPDAFSPFKVVEIATEADFEYTNALGSSANANNDILGVMNGIQAIYQRDIGLTFSVVFQHTWTTADPFSTAGPDFPALNLLNSFRTYWNANFANTPRDVAHLWTGKSVAPSAGIAFTGEVCRNQGTLAYGLSDLEKDMPFRIGIPAHEIGHNFGARHPDDPPAQAGCDNTIMNSVQNQFNNLTFCQFSIDEMTSYVNANSSCLSNAPAGNPIDQPDFFVKQQYLDFLNRTADASGLNFWTNEITSCGANQACIDNKRVNVSAAFFLSIEFQQTGYLVERLYKTAYNDLDGTSTFGGTHPVKVPIVRFANEFLPDTQQIGRGVIVGQNGWEAVLESNKVAFCDQFVTRQRFTTRYPANMLPTDFVHTLNQNAGSPLSPTDETTLALQLAAGQTTRAKVLRQIAEHPTLVNSEFNKAFLLMQFFGYLRRNPDDLPDTDYTGYDFWLTKLNNFTQPGDDVLVRVQKADMVKAFITSTEYRKRFGTP